METAVINPETPEFTETPETPGRTYWYVNVYRLDRHFGGQEEGGWWYTSYEPVYSERCYTEAFAWFRVPTVEEQYPHNGNSGSVNYYRKDDDFSIFVENEPGKYKPEKSPHYE